MSSILKISNFVFVQLIVLIILCGCESSYAGKYISNARVDKIALELENRYGDKITYSLDKNRLWEDTLSYVIRPSANSSLKYYGSIKSSNEDHLFIDLECTCLIAEQSFIYSFGSSIAKTIYPSINPSELSRVENGLKTRLSPEHDFGNISYGVMNSEFNNELTVKDLHYKIFTGSVRRKRDTNGIDRPIREKELKELYFDTELHIFR